MSYLSQTIHRTKTTKEDNNKRIQELMQLKQTISKNVYKHSPLAKKALDHLVRKYQLNEKDLLGSIDRTISYLSKRESYFN